ncbi:MAG: hypothetical protein IPG91_17480 [Ideonella sp.]|nr:hypothetical protein [Ideonella sp.]
MIAFVVKRSLGEAREREQRFADLLAMSVDWYWKLDEELRFVHFQSAAGPELDARPDKRLGLTPWEMSDFRPRRRGDGRAAMPTSNHGSPSASGGAAHRRAAGRASSAAAAGRALSPAPSARVLAWGATSPTR